MLRILCTLILFLQLTCLSVFAEAVIRDPQNHRLTEKEEEHSNAEKARLAFNKDKELLYEEYQEKMKELGNTDEDQNQRRELLREYKAQLKDLQKNLRRNLGLKEKKTTGQPAIFSASASSGNCPLTDNYSGRNPYLKSFQRSQYVGQCPFRTHRWK